jgi:hypothetical protein
VKNKRVVAGKKDRKKVERFSAAEAGSLDKTLLPNWQRLAFVSWVV